MFFNWFDGSCWQSCQKRKKKVQSKNPLHCWYIWIYQVLKTLLSFFYPFYLFSSPFVLFCSFSCFKFFSSTSCLDVFTSNLSVLHDSHIKSCFFFPFCVSFSFFASDSVLISPFLSFCHVAFCLSWRDLCFVLSWIPWHLSFRYVHCSGQFTPKMKANAEPRLLSSLVWIDFGVVVSQHHLESFFPGNKM